MKNEDTNIDFYEEDGMIVITKEYHLRRGYCCKSGCRNCPYGYIKVIDEQHSSTSNKE